MTGNTVNGLLNQAIRMLITMKRISFCLLVLLGSCLATYLVSPSVYTQLATPNASGVAFGHVHLNVSDPRYHKRTN